MWSLWEGVFGWTYDCFCVFARDAGTRKSVSQECANQHDPAQTRITAELVFIYSVFEGISSSIFIFIYLYSDDDEDGNDGDVDDDDGDGDGDGAPSR